LSTGIRGSASIRRASWESTSWSSAGLVKLSNDWAANSFDFFQVGLELFFFGSLISIQPMNNLIAFVEDLFLVFL
jgi:hypothetical protein